MNIIAYVNNRSSLNQIVYEAEHAIKRLNREVTLYLLGHWQNSKDLPKVEGLTILTKDVHEFNLTNNLAEIINSTDRVYIDDFIQDNKYSEYTQVLSMVQWATVPVTLVRTSYNNYRAEQYKDDAYFFIYDSKVGKRIAQGFTHLKEILDDMRTSDVTRVYLLAHDNSFHSDGDSSLYSLIKNDPKLANHISSRFIIEDEETEDLTWELSARGVCEYVKEHGLLDEHDESVVNDVTIYSIMEELPIAEIHKHILNKRCDERYNK